MVAAVEFEIKRQIEALKKGIKLIQETRGWDEDKKCTYIQRIKEEANDYRYFPEPDLPQLTIYNLQFTIEDIKKQMPELSWNKINRFVKEFEIKLSDAKILAESKEMAQFFERAVEHGKKHKVKAKEIANYIVNSKPDIDSILPTQVIEVLLGKKVGVIDDVSKLEEIVKEIIKENPRVVEIYKRSLVSSETKNGNANVVNVLIGKVMAKTSGKANAEKVKEILEKLTLL